MYIICNKKILIYGIIILFIGAAVLPGISGNTKMSIQTTIDTPTFLSSDNDFVNAYWKFDECSGDTLGDSSNPKYDGDINGATWTTSGYSGCALVFDGINDYVNLSQHAVELGFNKTDDLIITVHFKSEGEGLIYSATASWGFSPEFRIELLSNGTLLFYVITQMCGIILYSNGTYADGEWHNATYFFNGITSNPTVTLYVDNTFDSEMTHWLCEIEHDDYAKAKIGMNAHSSKDYFDGVIDEFKIIKYELGNEQEPPSIDGPKVGEPEEWYDYTFITDDPEGDEIWLYIDWEDDDPDEWIGPYNSGQEVVVSHRWDEEGKYNITARSKDRWHHSSLSDKYIVRIGNQPPDPPVIDGPRCGDIGEELTYTFLANDFENHSVSYYVDWGDGTYEDWFGPYPPGEEATASHSWGSEGDYEITAITRDEKGKVGEPSDSYLVRIGNIPPETPIIDGPQNGKIDVEYTFFFTSTDSEGDNVIYDINWGDGTTDINIGPHASGITISQVHTWEEDGDYIIEAVARDESCNYSSDPSEFEITIPRNKAFDFNLLEWLFERFPQLFPILKNLLDS
jgi:hypothetical protein